MAISRRLRAYALVKSISFARLFIRPDEREWEWEREGAKDEQQTKVGKFLSTANYLMFYSKRVRTEYSGRAVEI